MIILDECARILSCTSKNLCDKLNSPIDRSIILKELLGRKVQTTYRDEHGFYHAFTIKGLTTPGADSLQAYWRIESPFNVNVVAHFYAYHKIKLRHPFLPCMIEKIRINHEILDRYYPLELLQYVKKELPQLDNEQQFFSHGSNDDYRSRCEQREDL